MDEIPGIGIRSAQRILAETGLDMKQFHSAAHFSSWAGLVPGCNESAGKRKNTRLRKGNPYLKTVMIECALAAIRNKRSFWYAKFSKIAPRRRGKRAVVAVAHAMLVTIYHMLKNNAPYIELGSDYYSRINAEKIKNRNLKSFQSLGFHVTLSPLAP